MLHQAKKAPILVPFLLGGDKGARISAIGIGLLVFRTAQPGLTRNYGA